MSQTFTVKATGNPVPRFDNGTRYITDAPVEVPQNGYYLRRIADGELVEVKPAAPSKDKG